MRSLVAFLRRQSYSLWDLGAFLLNAMLTAAYLGAGLFFSTRAQLQPSEVLGPKRWSIIGVGTLALLACTYLRELVINRRKEQRIKGAKLIYDCIGGALERLVEIRKLPAGERSRFVNELLRYIEKVVWQVLKDNGMDPEEICANLMIKEDDHLSLEYFGTRLTGRTKTGLSLDPPNPGAPQAYVHRQPVYVDHTMSKDYQQFFKESKSYRSIVSVPVPLHDDLQEIFAVVNIDSTKPHQFGSQDFVSKKIIPAVTPFISLLWLERDCTLEADD